MPVAFPDGQVEDPGGNIPVGFNPVFIPAADRLLRCPGSQYPAVHVSDLEHDIFTAFMIKPDVQFLPERIRKNLKAIITS